MAIAEAAKRVRGTTVDVVGEPSTMATGGAHNRGPMGGTKMEATKVVSLRNTTR